MLLIGGKVVVSCRPYTCSLRIPDVHNVKVYLIILLMKLVQMNYYRLIVLSDDTFRWVIFETSWTNKTQNPFILCVKQPRARFTTRKFRITLHVCFIAIEWCFVYCCLELSPNWYQTISVCRMGRAQLWSDFESQSQTLSLIIPINKKIFKSDVQTLNHLFIYYANNVKSGDFTQFSMVNFVKFWVDINEWCLGKRFKLFFFLQDLLSSVKLRNPWTGAALEGAITNCFTPLTVHIPSQYSITTEIVSCRTDLWSCCFVEGTEQH